ncbi:hypothetical protein ScPMuIL_012529 [Solemya velum]
MELKGRAIPLLVIVAIIGLIVAGVFHIIGMATPNWEQTFSSYQGPETLVKYSGLWAICNRVSVDTYHCEPFIELEEHMPAVQALCILGFMCGVCAIIFLGLYVFLASGKVKGIFKVLGITTCFLAGLFVMIGIIIYGVKLNESEPADFLRRSYNISWSFGLSATSAVICIVSGLLATIGAVRK